MECYQRQITTMVPRWAEPDRSEEWRLRPPTERETNSTGFVASKETLAVHAKHKVKRNNRVMQKEKKSEYNVTKQRACHLHWYNGRE